MRIGMMCHSSFGGSVRIGTELSLELARRKHRVHLFTRTTPFGRWDDANGVILHRIVLDDENSLHPSCLYTEWSNEEYQAFLTCLLRLIAEEELDILHFHYAAPFAFIAEEVKRRLQRSAPLVIGTLHGTDVNVYGQDPAKGPRLAQALRNLDGLTTVSFSHARLAAKVFGLAEYPQVIPNFIDLSKFRPQSDSQKDERGSSGVQACEGRSKRRLRIVHVSNFRPIKDPQSVATIFLGIRGRIDSELWLIGDGQGLEILKSIFKRKGVEKDVCFWGLRHHLAPILAQADLLLMPSLSESFCLAALEAMACGVPVLATNVGGLPEVVTDGKTGFLFPIGDHSSAIELAVNLLSNPDQHRTMREAAVIHARRFGHDQIVPIYEEFYKRLFSHSDKGKA